MSCRVFWVLIVAFPEESSSPGSVQLRFVRGTVRLVPVFGSDDSSAKGFEILGTSVEV